MIERVLEESNPDIMLLQEANEIIKGRNLKRTLPYNSLKAILAKYERVQAKRVEQAQILYKRDIFEKVSPSPVNVDSILKTMFPPERNLKINKIKERICVLHLRHKATRHDFVFVCHHNIRRGGGNGVVKEMASKVCKFIAKMQEYSGLFVIAGVDLNCLRFNPDGAIVLPYDPTPRRKAKAKVDFFIIGKPLSSGTLVQSVKALDIFPSGNKEPFYKHFQELLKSNTEEQYKDALDHDPLILYLQPTL